MNHGRDVLMSVLQRGSDIQSDIQGVGDRERTRSLHFLPKRLSIHVFHDQEMERRIGSDVDHPDDVGMTEGSHHAGFLLKSRNQLRFLREMLWDGLDCIDRPEGDVSCLVDDTHPASAQLTDDFVFSGNDHG
jgi:hypothetical protein